jgi:hypothetical protein
MSYEFVTHNLTPNVFMTLKATIQAATIVYTVTSRYYASYLSHTEEYINWILITCSVQIIAVVSPVHNFLRTTPLKVLFGHVRLYTNFPLNAVGYVSTDHVCVSVMSVLVWCVLCLWSSRILWTHYIIYMTEKVGILHSIWRGTYQFWGMTLFNNICRHIGFLRIVNLVHWVTVLLDSCV